MRKRNQLTLVLGLLLLLFASCEAQEQKNRSVSKNGMEVHWHFKQNRIFFTMKAPTRGWVAIGFNTTEKMTHAYLLMGRIAKNQAEVVEHFTIFPGAYEPIKTLGGITQVQDMYGSEKVNTTVLHFSLPVKALGQYQKDLLQGNTYFMVLAYSQEDDFQHHSSMRTSINVEL